MSFLATLLGVKQDTPMYMYMGRRGGRVLYSVCRVIREEGDRTLVQAPDGSHWLVGVREPFNTDEFGGGSIFYRDEAECLY